MRRLIVPFCLTAVMLSCAFAQKPIRPRGRLNAAGFHASAGSPTSRAHGGAGLVWYGSDKLFVINADAGGYSAYQRAKIVAGRLGPLVSQGRLARYSDIKAGQRNGEWVVMIQPPVYYDRRFSEPPRSFEEGPHRHRHPRPHPVHTPPVLLLTVDRSLAAYVGSTPSKVVNWWRDRFRQLAYLGHIEPAYRSVKPAESYEGAPGGWKPGN